MFLYQSKNGAESASVVNVCGLNSVEVVAQVRTGKSTVCAADIYNLMTVCDLSQWARCKSPDEGATLLQK